MWAPISKKGVRRIKKFWNWVKNETGRSLYLDGYIAPESWFEDEVTPKEFKKALEAGTGDITVWINSPGGDFFAASQIYTMLKDYPGEVLVKIDGVAASAAAVIAMAGDLVLMSPTAMLMIHNPATFVWGEETDMQKGIEMLAEVKEAIINAFEAKTGLVRTEISKMMDAETWFSAGRAVELKFADEILYSEAPPQVTDFMFDKVTVVNALMQKLPGKRNPEAVKSGGAAYEQLIKRLELIR